MQDRSNAACTASNPSAPSPMSFSNTRLPYQHPTPSTSSPFFSYPETTFTFPSKSLPSLPPSLSRQPSFDLSHLLTHPPFPLSRQSSLTTFPLEDDPFTFLAFDSPDAPFKLVDTFDPSTRVSSYDSNDSNLSSASEDWPSGAGEEDFTPRSPQSSASSVSDSSQSSNDAELYTTEDFPPALSYEQEQQWPIQHEVPIKVEDVSVNSLPLSSLPVPLLPLPFTQPLYAFNYHSEEEPTPTSHPSRHDRREGLRGGGDSRSHYRPRSEQDSSDNDNDSSNDGSYDNSASSTPPTTSPPSSSFVDSVSPKSLLLSLSASRNPASTSASHSSHFSPSSPSPAYSTSSVLSEELDPNEVVIGIYTRAERAAKIARYREKRANRQWKKKIMYGCRKSFADNRPRVGGRFIKMKGNEQER